MKSGWRAGGAGVTPSDSLARFSGWGVFQIPADALNALAGCLEAWKYRRKRDRTDFAGISQAS